MKMAKKIILASQSPRRKELLSSLGVEFTTQSLNIDESYPSQLKGAEITEYLVKKKSEFFRKLSENEVLITADTIVWHKDKALEKPKNEQEAFNMLRELSGENHQVFTSVGFTTKTNFQVFTDKAEVSFLPISEEEIQYYIRQFNPMDKAGSYGIQEWIGLAKINKIEGSYFTIMGFPTHLVYQYLKEL